MTVVAGPTRLPYAALAARQAARSAVDAIRRPGRRRVLRSARARGRSRPLAKPRSSSGSDDQSRPVRSPASRSTYRARWRPCSPQPRDRRIASRRSVLSSSCLPIRPRRHAPWGSPARSEATRPIYGGDPNRIHNVQLVAHLVDNKLIAPDATFSFNGTTGERSAEKGFLEAPVIINGELADRASAAGSARSRRPSSTPRTRQGCGSPPRTNHSLYISHYPLGRDATVNYPDTDLQVRQRHAALAAPANVRSGRRHSPSPSTALLNIGRSRRRPRRSSSSRPRR